ncbi:hypothetical protein O181_007758 [Austropuccinia psidii MF-1]|uniref:Uncharacterized protein n=1 Tax=Austropuccinia psidii MF-1 TaxID=1389203 RepID=A0A9Q3BN35_9BASI|nr:hypothetical protein [Austropuccinia psidii MF-1]
MEEPLWVTIFKGDSFSSNPKPSIQLTESTLRSFTIRYPNNPSLFIITKMVSLCHLILVCALGFKGIPSALGKPINVAYNSFEMSSRLVKRMHKPPGRNAASYAATLVRGHSHSSQSKVQSAAKQVEGVGASEAEAAPATSGYWATRTILGNEHLGKPEGWTSHRLREQHFKELAENKALEEAKNAQGD